MTPHTDRRGADEAAGDSHEKAGHKAGCILNRPEQQSLFDDLALPDEPMLWEREAETDRLAAQIVLNRPLETVYHYLIPDVLRDMVAAGQRVRVPFGRGNRLSVGFCVGVARSPETVRELKSVESVIDREPLLSPRMLELTRWIAGRYLCGWGQVLESVVPAGVKNQAGTRSVSCFEPVADIAKRLETVKLPAKQQAVLDVLVAAGRPLNAAEISDLAGCGTSPVNGLRKKGLIRAQRRRALTFDGETGPVAREDDLTPNRAQQLALKTICAQLRAGRHRTLLLHGVTGSGKTEVYIQAIREVVSYGRQAIVLVPEISLTPQTIRRFRSRFDSVAVLHSHLSDAERHWQWQQIAQGGVQVVVGARSAIFAPTPHLGLIVIDEEHETSFKQDTTPRYHARDVARERARLEGIPLVLGSATPTLESWWRVETKQDSLISLPDRVQKLPLPPVVVVDVRNDPQTTRGDSIGRALQSAMRVALNDGGQIILFLNVRGFSPVLWCRACGKPVKCPHCDITLTLHRDRRVALCHSCDYECAPPSRCPGCDHASIRFFGAGTQRLEQEVRAKFPGVSCVRMDSDSMRKPGSHERALESFRSGDVSILLGTQMIAKGLDFPNVTLVGVVEADTVLHQPDLRASERTFQLIAQVAGRTGRSDRGGRVFVQTSSPTEPAILAASRHDYHSFAKHELQHRREQSAPPFRCLARIILRGADETILRAHAKVVSQHLQKACTTGELAVRVLGPAPAPVAKIRGQYRYHLQLASEDVESIHELWKASAEAIAPVGSVEMTVDVDPINMR